MNQTTSGCGNCYYYFNGQCTKVDTCMHIGSYDTITLHHNETYNHIIGINEYDSNLPYDIVNNLPDDIIMPDLNQPDELHRINSSINYNVQIGVFYCAICGKDIPWFEGQNSNKVRVCDECKQAITWAKEKMKGEKTND